MVTAVAGKGEEKGEEEEGGCTDRKEGDTDTRSRSHETTSPPSHPPLVSPQHSWTMRHPWTSMDIPVSSVPTMPPLQPTHI